MDKSRFFSAIEQTFAENGLAFADDSRIKEILFAATDIILEKNKVMNLTAICNEEEFASRHWADALLAEKFIPEGASLLDVGTGAGILAIAYAAARSDVTVLALDSTAKKAAFVAETAKTLGLGNLSAISARAEVLSRDKKYREKFDVVCARAVAAMPVLTEFCLPFAKVGGAMYALKGKNGDEELASAVQGIKRLGGKVKLDEKTELKEISAEGSVSFDRHIIIVEKIAKTPDIYPRRYAQITKNPL